MKSSTEWCGEQQIPKNLPFEVMTEKLSNIEVKFVEQPKRRGRPPNAKTAAR